MRSLTKKAILQGFQELLEEVPFDKITVSMLVKRCGIHHNTFYYERTSKGNQGSHPGIHHAAEPDFQASE